MSLKNAPELSQFLSTSIADADMDADEQATKTFAAAAAPERLERVLAQARALSGESDLPLEEIGTVANRWFGDSDEARAWLAQIIAVLSAHLGAAGAVIVKDSNGTPLNEGDSVLVIKDLKVKGGSSDLKRGTMVRKIHLVDAPDVIECRVDGSTLVLKTCFLKKA